MYYYFLHKSNSIPLKRVIMILSASLEFEKKYNSEIVERSSDEYEMPQVNTHIIYIYICISILSLKLIINLIFLFN